MFGPLFLKTLQMSASEARSTVALPQRSNIVQHVTALQHGAFDAPLASVKTVFKMTKAAFKAAFKALDGAKQRLHLILARKVHRTGLCPVHRRFGSVTCRFFCLRLARCLGFDCASLVAAENGLYRKLLSSPDLRQLRYAGLLDHADERRSASGHSRKKSPVSREENTER